MRAVILQPPYPPRETAACAADCLQWMRDHLEELKPGEQNLILLPEYATTPGLSDLRAMRAFAAQEGAAFQQFAAASAHRLHCLLVTGGIARSGARWFNRTFVFDESGRQIFAYDKIQLTAAEESGWGLTPGDDPAVCNHRGLRIGFATCFDIYFPEHFAALAAQQADLVLCPGYQRSESAGRIRTLAQARALDTGVYLLRASYAMPAPMTTGGHSLAAGPDGSLLADAGSTPGVLRVEFDATQKFVKPASHGQPLVEHRALLASRRRLTHAGGAAAPIPGPAAPPFPWLCAHRGLSHACPENTLPAFAAAIAVGAHEIEFDVRLSRDGVPVICHDDSVDRVADGTGRISELTWLEIQRLDAGAHLGAAWRGVRLPRLEEVLRLAAGRVGLNIHIKPVPDDGATIRLVCGLLTRFALARTACLALETDADMQTARDYAPEIARNCLITQDRPAASLAAARRHQCRRIQFFTGVTDEHIREAHAAGLVCNLFYADDPAAARAQAERGIDVILTNCAHTLIAAGFTRQSGAD